MPVVQNEWILDSRHFTRSSWIMELVHFGESLGEKCFAVLEGNEGDHQRTYLSFGEGIILSRETFKIPENNDSSPSAESPDPLTHLRRFLQSHHPDRSLESGLIGCLDFEWGLAWQRPKVSLATPNYFFRFCPINLILIPSSSKLILEVFAEEEESLKPLFKKWSSELDHFLFKPQGSSHPLSSSPSSSPGNSLPDPTSTSSPQSLSTWHSNIPRRDFLEHIQKIKAYIQSGDIFQAVPSQCFVKNVQLDPWVFYEKLRHLNPSPYLFCVLTEKETLVGSSPELLISSAGSRLLTRPIAGTRPRGKTSTEDDRNAQDLLNDPKERAEHAMLVDLGRNDLGRVSQFGSVKVKDYAKIQRFSYVMHLASTVEGQLSQAFDSFEALKAVFPAGTLSGAPKVRALEILQELEPEGRGAYGGALGIVRWNGDLDFCITIRTLSIRDTQVRVQAGAGIVFDSIPENEFEETVHKAQALIKAVEKCVSDSRQL